MTDKHADILGLTLFLANNIAALLLAYFATSAILGYWNLESRLIWIGVFFLVSGIFAAIGWGILSAFLVLVLRSKDGDE